MAVIFAVAFLSLATIICLIGWCVALQQRDAARRAGALDLRPPSENVDRSTDPKVRARIREEADLLSVGPPVTMPREVANYAENLIIRLLDADLIGVMGYGYRDYIVAGCRKAISDAIEATDKTREGEPARPDAEAETDTSGPCSYPGCGKPTAYVIAYDGGYGYGWRHVDPADEAASHVGYPMPRDGGNDL